LEKAEKLLTGQINKLTGFSFTIVNTMAFNATGSLLFIGDNKGIVRTYTFNDKNLNLSLVGKTAVSKGGKSISSVRFRQWQEGNETHDALLINSCDSNVRIFWIPKIPTSNAPIVLQNSFHIKNKREVVRSSFCPLFTNRDSLCIVSGSEDGTIYMFDIQRDYPPINELQGHAGIVYDVTWNHDETLLASCDSSGTVILWKRVLNVE